MPYRRSIAPFEYAFPLDLLVPALKYDGALANARVLGVLLAEAVLAAGAHHDVAAIVPLPLHPSRLVERGFNQSHELARVVARALRVPVLCYGLRRVRATPPQVGLSRAERLENMRDAFVADRDAVAGRVVALVDDVVTTGSTVATAALALRAADARSVDVWSVARALE